MVSVDWNYYNANFPKVSEGRFNELRYRACSLIERRIYTEVLPSECEMALLSDCACEVINMLDSFNDQNLISISNDGYSKTFQPMGYHEQMAMVDSIISEFLGGTRLLKPRFVAF